MSEYDSLLNKALACIRKDIEGRFELARILRDLVMLAGDIDHVARDLQWQPGDIQRYINVAEMFGDRRLPDVHSRPASWRVYARLASEYRDDAEMQEIAFTSGRPGFDAEEDRRRRVEEVSRRVWRAADPVGVEVVRGVRAGLAVSAAAQSIRRAARQLSSIESAGAADSDALADLRANYLELTKHLIRLGLVETAQRLAS